MSDWKMADAKCAADKYWSKSGRCCDRCPAGSFVRADCDHAAKTQCDQCGRGLYTATTNHLTRCRVCKSCSSSNNQIEEAACSADKDTVCKCKSGFFCSGDPCDYCMPATFCPLGSGVKVQTRGANDTICAPCKDGTYSNVSDSHSACQTHTRCKDSGRVLKTAGTSTADAVCGDLISGCPWILPAGLWLGFVLSVLLVLGLMYWRAKCKPDKSGRSKISIPAVRTTTKSLLEAPPHTHKSFEPCQEPEACKCTTLFCLDESSLLRKPEHNGDLPLPLKTDCNGTEACHRSHSEPQEDEWCGT